MKFTESMLNSYAQPLSQTENQQCKNAINMVVNALKPLGFKEKRFNVEPMYTDTYSYFQELESEYGSRRIKVFLQGSYANNTNVRTQSDVDIAVVEEDIFQTQYRVGVSDSDYGFTTATPRPKSFKDEVEDALKGTFGSDVQRANKSIKINGNTYRKDADSVPCRRHKNYSHDYSNNPDNFIGGIVITADTGERIINYPEQHIKNGKEKNVSTNYYYKKMVRIIKKMRYLMKENMVNAANSVSSFALESLLWNIPNDKYLEYKDYRNVFMFDMLITYLKNNSYLLSTYKEANGIKLLCPTQTDKDNMELFIHALEEFYEYE
ncbi:nucleotidyltransferase [Virgibacillus halodenitrificans]|uniref:nucleotidyltransferase domain-containing protein n=1 Tax=Virgibacillus halodenitrificans TaxID=1482 RepID=UPI00136D793B|nr:nucleotidyltransferase [Virgibacillus halodenitrificans]MYL47277.1 nucleotidyltransferase [Virgibacillus halodenitrificans]